MKNLSTAEIRTAFLEFFKAKGHTEVASSALVPANDPTLLFTNAGMVQFKDVFTGKESRDYQRATTAQKCLRAGGKHNDLENVGYTTRHHTFFEMLGNFSFGDYFKKDAIDLAWTFLRDVVELPVDRLCVTVFAGEDGIPADDEAAELWAKVGVPQERIFRLGKKENYWQMGDTGPQGPCSEIHYWTDDHTPPVFEAGPVERSEGWVEIWNLVFMQFVRETVDGALEPLPKPSVDTGMGLERLAVVLQGKSSNYDIDVFQALLERIAKDARKSYASAAEEDRTSMRVIADHARATAFLIADGVQPAKNDRGYVLRRIMRRAIRHGKRLGFEELFFHRACLAVVDGMAPAYPELERARALIEKVAQMEETAFRKTLDKGMRLVAAEIETAKNEGRERLPVGVAGKLYGTYGFPVDLTRVIANESGLELDEDEVKRWVVSEYGDDDSGGDIGGDKVVDKLWFTLRESLGASEFLGYAQDDADATVQAIIVGKRRVEKIEAGQKGAVLLDRTPFYGESGGQVGDRGRIESDHAKLQVTDATKPLNEVIAHHVEVMEGKLSVGDRVSAHVDSELRDQTRRNHSATHLLHLALREVLGEHVQQKGSLVAPDRLRFDYSHFDKLSEAEVEAIERRVNEMILANFETKSSVGTMEDAKGAGAVMLFGEKYGDEVRMVRIGRESLELCGGTHVERAGEIGLFKITADGPLGSGVRRLEAATGMHALRWVQAQDKLLKIAAQALKVTPENVPSRIDKLQRKNKALERDLENAQVKLASAGGNQGGATPASVEEFPWGVVQFTSADGTPSKALRTLSDQLRDKLGSGLVVLTAKDGDKVTLLVAATKDLKGTVNAGQLVKAGCEAMGGRGGGRPDFAQGSGRADQLDAGIEAVRAVLQTVA